MGGRFFKGCRFATGGREVVFFQTTARWKGSVTIEVNNRIFFD